MHCAGQSRLGSGRGGLALAKGDFLRLTGVQSYFCHALQGSIGCAQHSLGSYGSTAEGFNAAAIHGAQTLELLPVFFLLPAAAQGLSFLEVGIAHHAGGYGTIGIHAQGHSHAVGVTGLGRLHAIAYQIAVCIQCLVQAVHTVIGVGSIQGDLLIALGRHDRAEGLLQCRHFMLRNGALGQLVGCSQHHRSDYCNDGQGHIGRKLLFLGRIVFHAMSLHRGTFPVV